MDLLLCRHYMHGLVMAGEAGPKDQMSRSGWRWYSISLATDQQVVPSIALGILHPNNPEEEDAVLQLFLRSSTQLASPVARGNSCKNSPSLVQRHLNRLKLPD